ncbi:hypothetical protein PG990_001824 [Apiospora arundinis]|uniref:Uncharacterized protein n=1 Tax=Apiospora arundinis TaxID=335852 RepID=A0ABR2I400_9PEZI
MRILSALPALTWAVAALPSSPATNCGTSIAQARSLGCKVSLKDGRWLPPLCYDDALDAQWIGMGWKYFKDQNGTDAYSPDELKTGNIYEYFIDMEAHLTHCAFGIKTMHNAYLTGQSPETLPSYIVEDEHVDHCMKFLSAFRKPIDGNSRVTMVHLNPDGASSCYVPKA